MHTQFSQDLRLARRKAGYTQGDVAHLLDCQQSIVSKLESGKSRPCLEQIVTLSLIYGRSFESLFAQVMSEAREHLGSRLASLPDLDRQTAQTFNRESSLKRLRQRLKDEEDDACC